MHEPPSTPSSTLPSDAAETEAPKVPLGLVAQYQLEHRNPVNHFLHIGVGWPMVAAAVLIVPFRPLWSLGLFIAAYAIMFLGHFVFEGNSPTIFKEPTTPFVIAFDVIRKIGGAFVRLAKPERIG
jgi:hypothetical protein